MEDPLRAKGGFADLVGYELTAWRPDEAEISLTVGPEHLNRSGVMHGGVLTTLIDTACGYAGNYADPGDTPTRSFTLSLNSHFVATAQNGAQLTAKAWRSGGGKSVFFAACLVTDQEGTLIGQGAGVFKYIVRPQ